LAREILDKVPAEKQEKALEQVLSQYEYSGVVSEARALILSYVTGSDWDQHLVAVTVNARIQSRIKALMARGLSEKQAREASVQITHFRDGRLSHLDGPVADVARDEMFNESK
jgi:hypothetical protein